MISINTKIILTYSGSQSIKSLLNDDNYMIYSWDKKTKLPTVTTLFTVGTKIETRPTLKVEFDSGLNVFCTPEQNFYVFRGYTVPAKSLQVGQSIRAFSGGVHQRDGHIRVHGWVNGNARHRYTARMIWEYFFGKVPKGMIIHHKDYNKINNDIKNLELLTNSEHNRLHYADRQRGRYGRNHKVVSVELFGQLEVVNLFVENNTFIIADDKPIAGDFSGIVLSTLT